MATVINAVDDSLLKTDQLALRWNTNTVRVLPALLAAARDAGRVVVLTSDHGHVVEQGTSARPGGDSDRYRPASEPPQAGEIEISGSYVQSGGSQHRLVAAWSESLRYGGKKTGYHGGVSLQEMAVPFAALWFGTQIPPGLQDVAAGPPAWWLLESPVAREPVAAPKPLPMPSKKTEVTLFGPAPTEPATPAPAAPALATPWIARLLKSGLFETQRRLAGRTPPLAPEVAKLVQCLHESGGKLTRAALARALDTPELRLAGYVAQVRRVLNVEGYPVLSVHEESGTIELNVPSLRAQLGIEKDAAGE